MASIASNSFGPLAAHAFDIAGAADRQSVRYIESTWRSWLSRAEIRSTVVDRVFGAIGPDTVSRRQIRTLAEDIDSPDGRLTLLIAALVWGRGTANGRMRDPILRAITHSNRDDVLQKTTLLAGGGALADAYNAWTLPGLQAAFFTKWLWAATSLRPNTCCLVLDKRVWNSLGALGWNSLEAAGGQRDWGVRYAAYVDSMHECADKVGQGVTAEDLEYTLFRINGNLDAL